jgi:hypothetical protein
MRNSSQKQLELDYSSAESMRGETRVDFSQETSEEPSTGSPGSSSAPFRIPDFSAFGEVYAVTSRLAGRINAANVSEKEHNALLRERQTLLDKKFDKTITRVETNKLEYIRWSLDRIEDAKFGHEIDVLDDYLGKYEKFLEEIGNFEKRLQLQLPKKRK